MSTLKVVVLGDLGVGKTCLRLQFVHHVFTNAYKATIGGDYLALTIEVDGPEESQKLQANLDSPKTLESGLSVASAAKPTRSPPLKVNLQVWDTAGQERFNSISQAFYRGADVVVLVYDTTNYELLLSVREWFARFLAHCQVPKPGVLIVGTKTDKVAERCVDLAEIRDVLCRNGNLLLDDYVADWLLDLVQILCKVYEDVESVFRRAAQIGSALVGVNHVGKTDSIQLGPERQTRCCY